MQRLRILVADDDSATLAAVQRLLGSVHDVVGTVGDGASLLSAAKELHPDVLVVDIAMPVMNGLEAVRRYRRSRGTGRILFLTNHLEPAIVEAALAFGADGLVPKVRAAEELMPAICDVANGRTFVSPSLAGRPSDT